MVYLKDQSWAPYYFSYMLMIYQTLFADDATAYASSSSLSYLGGLINHELSILADWFKAKKLSVNVGKTNFIVFTKRRQQDVVNITLDGENIARKEVVKFLGVFVDHHLSWSEHVKHCKTKIVSALYALKSARKQQKFSFSPQLLAEP